MDGLVRLEGFMAVDIDSQARYAIPGVGTVSVFVQPACLLLGASSTLAVS